MEKQYTDTKYLEIYFFLRDCSDVPRGRRSAPKLPRCRVQLDVLFVADLRSSSPHGWPQFPAWTPCSETSPARISTVVARSPSSTKNRSRLTWRDLTTAFVIAVYSSNSPHRPHYICIHVIAQNRLDLFTCGYTKKNFIVIHICERVKALCEKRIYNKK